jgi:hypothetical protein
VEDWVDYLEKAYGVKLVRATAEESLDALLADGPQDMENDDATLEELLSSTASDLAEMTQ